MNIFKVLQRKSRFFYLSSVTLGVVNTLVYSLLLMFINAAVSNEDIVGNAVPWLAGYSWMIFAALIIISMLSTKVFQGYMVKLTYDILYDYELSVLDKLRKASYQAFEKLGAQRVYTSIGDVRVLGHIPEVLIAVINSAVIILCALGYLFWIAPIGGLMVLGLMTVLLLFYFLRNKHIEKDLNEVRDLQNSYHSYLKDLLYGFRQIKLSTKRNETLFHKFLKQNRHKGKVLGQRTANKYLNNELTGTYSWYIALGIVIFALPNILPLSNAEIVPFIVVILYLMGPLASLVKVVPYYTNVKIALERINDIEKEVSEDDDLTHVHVEPARKEHFSTLEFKDVTFEYFDEKDRKVFKVGPINLTIKPGEVIFITGGNGSGKSTFVNLLVGLYKIQGGQILLNGRPVSDNSYPFYCNQFSAIFTNHYLFQQDYDEFNITEDNEQLKQYMEKMNLEKILKINETSGHIDTGLSQGQRKRLAMIYALLEKRDIIVLDEWAAEQDPVFRAYFYEELVPYLKSLGKTVIAVTHDDHYFDHAERLVKFDFGRIVVDKKVNVVKEKSIAI